MNPQVFGHRAINSLRRDRGREERRKSATARAKENEKDTGERHISDSMPTAIYRRHSKHAVDLAEKPNGD